MDVKEICMEIFWLTSALLVLLICLPILILAVPMFTFQFFVRKLASIVHPELEKMLSAQANTFAGDLLSPNIPRSTIVIQLVIGGCVRVKDIRKLGQQALILQTEKDSGNIAYPEFRQYVEKWCGYHFWKSDSTFEIANHIKEYKNLQNAKSVTDDNIRDIMECLLNQKFAVGRSPWEMLVVNNYNNQDLSECRYDRSAASFKTVLFIRFHPTLCQGWDFFQSMLSSSQAKQTLYVPNQEKGNLFSLIRTSPHMVLNSQFSNFYIRGSQRNGRMSPDSKKLWRQNYSRSGKIPIQIIKEIQTEFDVAFSSILLCAVSSSLVKIMQSKGKFSSDKQDARFLFPFNKFHISPALNGHTNSVVKLLDYDGCFKKMTKTLAMKHIAPALLFLYRQFPSLISLKLFKNQNVIGNYPVDYNKSKFRLGSELCQVESVDSISGAFSDETGVAISAVTYEKHLQMGVAVDAGLLSRKEVDQLMKLIQDELECLHEFVFKSRKSKLFFTDIPKIIVTEV